MSKDQITPTLLYLIDLALVALLAVMIFQQFGGRVSLFPQINPQYAVCAYAARWFLLPTTPRGNA